MHEKTAYESELRRYQFLVVVLIAIILVFFYISGCIMLDYYFRLHRMENRLVVEYSIDDFVKIKK